mgnify:CR=1 FL=1
MTTNKPIRVQIKPQIVALLEPIKPEHQTMATFINDMLYRATKGLTPYVTLNLSSEQSSLETNNLKKEQEEKKNKEQSADKFSTIIYKDKEKKKTIKKSKKDLFASPNIKKEYIPQDLQVHADLIVEWWPIRHKKKATCSLKVANRIFDKLRTFTHQEQIKALEMAIIRGYKDVYKPDNQYNKEQPTNHPQSKVFKASEQNWPSLKVVKND